MANTDVVPIHFTFYLQVDIESLDDVMSPSTAAVYDAQKTKTQINETSRFIQQLLKSGRPETDEVSWTINLNQ